MDSPIAKEKIMFSTDTLIEESKEKENTNFEKTLLYNLNKYHKDYCKKLVQYAAQSGNMEQCVQTIETELIRSFRDDIRGVKNPTLKNILINTISQIDFTLVAKALIKQRIEGAL